MTDFDVIEQAHREFETKFKPDMTKAIDEGAKVVLAKEMKIDVEGFEFWVTTKILPKHIRLVTASKTNYDQDNFNYDAIVEPMAQFMEEVCIDKKLTKEFWINYNNDTGFLPDIVEYIVSNADKYKPQIRSFR